VPGGTVPGDTPTAFEPAVPGGTVPGDTPTAFEPAVPGLIAGIHYLALSPAAPTASGAGAVEVCEFFMFPCRHCYALQPALTAWAGTRSQRVALERVPVMSDSLARLHARAYYTAEVLGRGDEMTPRFYDEIHERGNPLATRAAVRAFFVRSGIDGASFDRVFESPEVSARLEHAESLSRLYRVDATPSIGVNGRYLTTSTMAGSVEQLFDVVDALVEAETAAQSLAGDCADDGSGACRIRMPRRETPAPGSGVLFR